MTAPTAALQEAKPGLLRRYLPILDWLPSYRREWLPADAVAALSVWALLVPQGLAYASIAGVPVQYGLYAAFAGLIAYAIFGTSRQLVQGPSGSVAAVSAVVVGPIVGAAALGTSKAVGYTAALALAAGVVYLLLGLLRMGWVSVETADPPVGAVDRPGHLGYGPRCRCRTRPASGEGGGHGCRGQQGCSAAVLRGGHQRHGPGRHR